MDLIQSFKDFIATEKLFSPGQPLRLAVSGGVDSVVLCECCHRAGFDFKMVHCNFQLRGEESLRDELFVQKLAEKYRKELLIGRFDTTAYAAGEKCSIQVAARELRYNWFALMTDEWILTAHHLDDNIETQLMNLFKGTGISGLRAILPRQGNILRPLLFARREEIEQFARQEGLEWVEDSSNQWDKYTRNFFRHQVIPLLSQVYPDVINNLADNIPRFREIEQLYRLSVDQQKKKLLEYRGEEVHISVLKLKKTTPLATMVYEVISEFGFTPNQVRGVIDLLDSSSGKFMRSKTFRILKDRNWLIISPLDVLPSDHVLIESLRGPVVHYPYAGGSLKLELLPAGESDPLAMARHAPQPSTVYLDPSEIRFPLLLRKWRKGDYFYPLGMRKKKKLARFFIDNKLSVADKEKIWVLEMDKKIIWVVGLRIDDRFRIQPSTKQVLKIVHKAEKPLTVRSENVPGS